MTWIFLVMLSMIGGSIVAELLLPMRIKQAMGTAICWMMMASAMTSLGVCTLYLLWVTWSNYIEPLVSSS